MGKIIRFIDATTAGAQLAACFCLVGTTVLILFEIAMRLVFDSSIMVAEEYAGYGMAAIVYLGSSAALRKAAHIRVGLLRDNLSDGARLWLDRGVLLVGIGFASVLALAFFNQFMEAAEYGVRSFHPSRTPLAIPYGVVAAGVFLLALQMVARLLDSFHSDSDLDGRERASQS